MIDDSSIATPPYSRPGDKPLPKRKVNKKDIESILVVLFTETNKEDKSTK